MAGDRTPFRDAEAWLAERGVAREPLRVEPAVGADEPRPAAARGSDEAQPAEETVPDAPAGGDGGAAGEVGTREAARLARQVAADAALAQAERAAGPPTRPALEDEVSRAVAFVRRSTAGAPQAEGRLEDKLLERGHPAAVVELALARARAERLIDDAAMVAALVEEKRRVGHAPARIRRDLRARGFDDQVLDPALAAAESEDQEAAAFAVATERAARLTAAPTETAYRRVVGHVTRRGYPEALARKVAREAVFSTRDAERTAGR